MVDSKETFDFRKSVNVDAYVKDVINITNKGNMSSQLSRILSDPIGNQINKSSLNKATLNINSGSKLFTVTIC